MAGTYSTDLQPVGTAAVADTGTYPTAIIELTGYTSGTLVSTTTPDTDNFIQGIAGITGLSSKTANTGNSIAYGRGSTLVINGGACLNMWAMYSLPSALATFGSTNGGLQIAVGTAAGSFSTYRVDGGDVSPYGGWKNYIVDLRNTNTGPNSGGSTGVTNPTNSYYGMTAWQIAAFKTAVPLAIDAIRYGRHTLSATGGTSTSINNVTPLTSTAANFPQMSNYNDWNAGGTPTFGAAVDGGYHRFGQLQDVGGSYLARGILSLGTASTSVYFNDANRNVNFQDMFVTYNDFNRIEIRNASSTVIMDSCSFSFIPRDSTLIASGSAPATPRGNFQMHDNALVKLDGCSFTDMGTFTFLTGAATSYVNTTTFRRCNQVTPAGMAMDSCLFTRSNDATGAIIINSPTEMAALSNCTFTNSTVAIKITTSGSYNFNGHQFSGNTWQVDFTGTGTCTITPSNGSNVTQGSVHATGGGTITVNAPAVNLTFEGLQVGSEVRVYLGTDPATATEIGGTESSDTSFTLSQSYNGQSGYYTVVALGYVPIYRTYIFTDTAQSIPIAQQTDRTYSNP
jgi:hypothetical protein